MRMIDCTWSFALKIVTASLLPKSTPMGAFITSRHVNSLGDIFEEKVQKGLLDVEGFVCYDCVEAKNRS